MSQDSNEFISNAREDFNLSQLSENDLSENPFVIFEQWLQLAIKSNVPEVQAMTLSTVSNLGKPSSRIVYLREFKNHRFTFYGNYNSKKGIHLQENKFASLQFFWPQLQKQIRIEGIVEKANEDISDSYFASRPRESQIGAWASNQSSKINSRQELENAIANFGKQFENKTVPRPPHWGGWVLHTNYYEFWQGRQSRLHDRFVYELENNNWKISRLNP